MPVNAMAAVKHWTCPHPFCVLCFFELLDGHHGASGFVTTFDYDTVCALPNTLKHSIALHARSQAQAEPITETLIGASG